MAEHKEFTFDKFVKDIAKREDEKRQKIKTYVDLHSHNPNRLYKRLYQERWQNRIHHIPGRGK